MRRAGALALTLFAAAGWAGAAMAQEARGNNAPPQERLVVSPGGVDMRSGRYVYDQTDLAIGGEGGALTLARVMPMPVSVTDPEGIRTQLHNDYLSRNVLSRTQLAKPGSTQPNGQSWPNLVSSATYTCTPATIRHCNKPLTTADARGNVTNFEYDPAHGGLLSETAPAPTAGAPRPQTRHIYAQRYAWIASGGAYVQAATPIWVRTATSLCRTSAATGNPAAPCASAGDEVLTQYDYGPSAGPNNLLLRGQTVTATDAGVSTTLRTCYVYDALGRRISETQPNANLASCP